MDKLGVVAARRSARRQASREPARARSRWVRAPIDWRADSSTEIYDRVRAEIIEAAAVCLEEHGLRGLRINQVAEAAGCSRATIYRYFSSKEELAVAVAVRTAQELSARILAKQAADIDPRDRIVEGIVDTIAAIRADPRLSMEHGDLLESAQLMTGSRVLQTAVEKILEPDMERARALGILRPGITTPEIAEWLILVCMALVNSSWPRGASSARSRKAQIAHLRRFLLPSIFQV